MNYFEKEYLNLTDRKRVTPEVEELLFEAIKKLKGKILDVQLKKISANRISN